MGHEVDIQNANARDVAESGIRNYDKHFTPFESWSPIIRDSRFDPVNVHSWDGGTRFSN